MGKQTEPILIFCDETYPDSSDGARLVVVAVAIRERDFLAFRPEIRKIAGLGARPRKRQLLSLVSRREFFTSVVTIDRQAVYGESWRDRDALYNIGQLSRTDLLWSQGVGYAVAYASRIVSSYWPLHPLNVTYHARNLRKNHRELWEGTLRTQIAERSTHEVRSTGHPGFVTVNNLRGISLPRSKAPFTVAEDGVWLADAIASLVTELDPSRFEPNFLFRDCTPIAAEVAAHIESRL